LVLLSVGCAGKDAAIEEAETCEQCLVAGGGWEMETEACVVECVTEDDVCATVECPPACGEECSGCVEQDECLGAGCVWIGSEEGGYFCAG